MAGILAIGAVCIALGALAYFIGKRAGYRSIWIWVALGLVGYLVCFVAGFNARGTWDQLAYIVFAMIIVTPAAGFAITGAAIGAFHRDEMARDAAKQADPAGTR